MEKSSEWRQHNPTMLKEGCLTRERRRESCLDFLKPGLKQRMKKSFCITTDATHPKYLKIILKRKFLEHHLSNIEMRSTQISKQILCKITGN